ncbi:hypothetical protein AVEN_194584-1 [Araneus ventricosus]|uniref:Uncharacterized protein n=1 Tax=Araneus ventricosus TaxID=182803 RepID=A0A4Y2A6A3_ARAVE|nr:hypothetical protein AVEN_194584-1 [Araneus ventricosus]
MARHLKVKDMPRVYERVFDPRKYLDHSPETVEACLNGISPGKCTLRDEDLGIPKLTIFYERKPLHIRKPG